MNLIRDGRGHEISNGSTGQASASSRGGRVPARAIIHQLMDAPAPSELDTALAMTTRWSIWGLFANCPVAQDYFQLLKAEGANVEPAVATGSLQGVYERWRKLSEHIEARFAKHDEVSLLCVLELEALLVKLIPDDRIRSRAWSVRSQYLALVPRQTAEQYVETNPPDLGNKKSPIAAVRADVQDLVGGLHWWYVSAYRREKELRQLKLVLLVLVGIGFLLVCGVSALVPKFAAADASWMTPFSMVTFVLYAGFLGAITSTLRRIQPVAAEPITASDPLIKSMALEKGNIGVYLSTSLGAIFAVVLAIAFAAGLNEVVGSLAPVFAPPMDIDCCGDSSLTELFESLRPATSTDFAKLLLWSFAAGFSERFVPDMLDRLTIHKE